MQTLLSDQDRTVVPTFRPERRQYVKWFRFHWAVKAVFSNLRERC